VPMSHGSPSAESVSTNASRMQTLATSARDDGACQSKHPSTAELLADHWQTDLKTHQYLQGIAEKSGTTAYRNVMVRRQCNNNNNKLTISNVP